jgi:prolipoprotein diacylglyceryltransferase
VGDYIVVASLGVVIGGRIGYAFFYRPSLTMSDPFFVLRVWDGGMSSHGGMIGLTLGQQSWLRLLNIEHHAVMAGTSASMAPGFEDADTLKRSKGAGDYWAKTSASEAAQ